MRIVDEDRRALDEGAEIQLRGRSGIEPPQVLAESSGFQSFGWPCDRTSSREVLLGDRDRRALGTQPQDRSQNYK
jgi:hypothetical protein